VTHPPLDDPRWFALKAALQVREKQTGDPQLAMVDLQQAMASGKLRSMRRDVKTGEYERLEPAFWPQQMDAESATNFYRLAYFRLAARSGQAVRRCHQHAARSQEQGAAGQAGTEAAWRLADADRAMARREAYGKCAVEFPAKYRRAGGRSTNIFAQPDRLGTK
jgi:hypothetical protein